MEEIIAAIRKSVVEQGFAVTMLAAIAFYFFKELNAVKEELKEMKEELKTYLKEDRAILMDLVKETKEALEQNSKIFEKIERKI